MASVQLNTNAQSRMEEFIKLAPKLETSVLEQFMLDLSSIIAKRKIANPAKREAQLIKAIYNAYSPKTTERLNVLSEKMFEETITEEELAEYKMLADESEGQSLERLQNLIKLAQLKNISVPELMKQMGLKKSVDA